MKLPKSEKLTKLVQAKKHWLAPAGFGTLVIVLSLTLLTVGARSPYTHLNLSPGYASGYNRTAQSVVGAPQPVDASMVQVDPSLNLPQQGEMLFMGLDCASCHGARGQGGVFAPPIAGTDAKTIGQKTSTGPNGMPKFTGLTDQDLQALSAYLQIVTAQSK